MRKWIDLSGAWQFSIGDVEAWRKPDLDDTDWESIDVPSTWEDQGFHGYNGYAWYRKSFRIDGSQLSGALMLMLGYIDDADEVYLNGQLVGFSGVFPPQFHTAYDKERAYPVPHDLLYTDRENVIAVRVYDAYMAGGISQGRIGIYKVENQAEPDFNLAGIWSFQVGDSETLPRYDQIPGKPILVPGKWEDQCYPYYDGYGWYHRQYCLPPTLAEEELVLFLGKIDDVDMVYINGKFVGATGLERRGAAKRKDNTSWLKTRIYEIPQGILDPNGNNIISVRVLDWVGDGGIYEGPVGFVRKSRMSRFAD